MAKILHKWLKKFGGKLIFQSKLSIKEVKFISGNNKFLCDVLMAWFKVN